MALGFSKQSIPWSLSLCPRCHERPLDPVLLGSKEEGHICGECWEDDREADDRHCRDVFEENVKYGGMP